MAVNRSGPIITHSDVEVHADFDSLYVARTFSWLRDGTQFDGELFESSQSSFRAVLMGTPGAGKSTYVRHFSKEMVRQGYDMRRPTILVQCREYFSKGWDSSLEEYCMEVVEVELA